MAEKIPSREQLLGRARDMVPVLRERAAAAENARRMPDEAVAAAYGWPADLSDDEILKRLLELNLERAAAQEKA